MHTTATIVLSLSRFFADTLSLHAANWRGMRTRHGVVMVLPSTKTAHANERRQMLTSARVAAWYRGAGVFVVLIAATVHAHTVTMQKMSPGRVPADRTVDRHRPARPQNTPGQTEPQTTGESLPQGFPCIAKNVYAMVVQDWALVRTDPVITHVHIVKSGNMCDQSSNMEG